MRSFSYQKITFGKHPAKILPLSDQSKNVQDELGGLELIEGQVEKCLYVRQDDSRLSVSAVEGPYLAMQEMIVRGQVLGWTQPCCELGFSHADSLWSAHTGNHTR